MKNILFKSVACIAAMAMTMSGCSNEEMISENGKPEMTGITSITLETPQGGPSTRLVYNTDDITNALGVKWKAGAFTNGNSYEKGLSVNATSGKYYGGVFARSDDGGDAPKATFIFRTFDENYSVSASSGGLELLYPHKTDYASAFDLVDASPDPIEITLPLTGQTGQLIDVEDFDYMTASATVEGAPETTDPMNIRFKHRIAIMRLTGLTLTGTANATATEVSISATGLKSQAKLVYTASNNVLSQTLTPDGADAAIATNGIFNIDGTGKMDDVYICFFPGNANAATGSHEITGMKITAKVGSDTYEYSYGDDAAVATKVTKFEEGKMYTLSGKVMTKPAAGKIYAIGDVFPSVDNPAGIVCFISDGGLHGKAFSTDEIRTLAWAIGTAATTEIGANDQNSGAANMAIVQATGTDWGTNYPAFKWCADHTPINGHSWYLPAVNEIALLAANYAKLKAIADVYFSSPGLGGYWFASSEHTKSPSDQVQYVTVSSGSLQSSGAPKTIANGSIRVRAMIDF